MTVQLNINARHQHFFLENAKVKGYTKSDEIKSIIRNFPC